MGWRFIDTGLADAFFNMALDKTLALSVGEGKSPPTLRVYRWKPYAISIGYHQNIKDINLSKCREEGIDLVRRPTGGRAVLHSEELTYSIVIPRGSEFFKEGILETYRVIAEALVRGLRDFGLNVTLGKPFSDIHKPFRSLGTSPCFLTFSRYEILLNGKKLVGSAQRRYSNSVLQHGSILTGDYHLKLGEFLNSSSGELEAALKKRTISISSVLRKPISINDLIDCLKRGFEEEWGVELEVGEVSKYEENLCKELTAIRDSRDPILNRLP